MDKLMSWISSAAAAPMGLGAGARGLGSDGGEEESVQTCLRFLTDGVETVGLRLPGEVGLWLCSVDVEAARGYAFVVLVAVLTLSVTPQVAGGIGITIWLWLSLFTALFKFFYGLFLLARLGLTFVLYAALRTLNWVAGARRVRVERTRPQRCSKPKLTNLNLDSSS